ncbi:MAG: fibronectin type III domain-containing protein [Firmicutes bacterium]|nr:fibronectin type III domain-containing protein [Bacillota bacterium]
MENTRKKSAFRFGAILLAVLMIFTAISFGAGEAFAASKVSQVKNLKLSKATTSSLKVKWGKTKNATEYQVAYKQLGKKSFNLVKTSKTYYTIPKLTQDKVYCVKVRAFNGSKAGKWSEVKKFQTKVNYAKASDESKVKVTVTSDKVKISIDSLGLSGKATLYSVKPNQYLTADKLSGIVKTNYKGTAIGTFSMSKSKTFTIDRMTKDGYDKAYDKYYVIYDKSIVKGPIYATTVASANRKVVKPAASKKGLIDELTEQSFEAAEDLGVSWTGLNIDFTQLLISNEDAAGNPVDNTGISPYSIDFNGKTYYMNKPYVDSLDYRLSRYEELGINVIAVVISFVESEVYSNYPDALKYIDDARWTNGFNTSTNAGRDYFIAGMEFLADRYSQSGNGLISNYVIGNEIDYAYDWNEIIPNKHKNGKTLPPRNGNKTLRTNEIETTADFDVYMEEYARVLRIANTAVRKYSKDATVSVSFTREWAKSIGKQNYAKPEKNKRYDSYAPKDILDWLNYYTKKSGDFNWALTPHNYPLADGDAAAYETGKTNGKVIITGDVDTTKKITQNNFEVLQMYLNRATSKYKGKVRSVYLTENGCSSGSESGTHSALMQKRQAAAVAQLYYRYASLPSVKAIAYYRITDRESEGATDYKIGLIDTNGKKKLAYDVWKYIDTDKSFQYSNKYLGYITFKKNGKIYSKANGKIKSYKDVMKVVDSNFNWNNYWNVDKLTPVETEK